MFVSETFYSIQGEGELTGVPSFFIRMSGCNLRCAWCDTPYASWNPEGRERSIPELVGEVKSSPGRHVVLTGGEPMMAKGIRDLAGELNRIGQHITIETAATVPPEGILCDLASLSPKLSNSRPDAARAGEAWVSRHEKTRWQPDVVTQWVDGYNFQFKFVVSSPGDVEELESMLAQLGRVIPAHKILLMPEATSLERMRERAVWLSELCKARGYRYAHRLHIELYGNKRGT